MRKKSTTLDQSTWIPARRLLRESVRPYVPRIVMAFACMAVAGAATAAGVLLVDPVVNRLFVERQADLLSPITTALFTVFVVRGLASYGQALLMGNAGLRIVGDLQQRLFAHLMTMDLAFFHTQDTRTLLSRLTLDCYAVRRAVTTAITGVGRDGMAVVFLVGVLFYQDWLLAALLAILFPIAILPAIKLGGRLRQASPGTHEELERLATLVEQGVQGMRAVKAYGMEDYQKARASGLVLAMFRRAFKAVRTRALASPVMDSLAGLAVAAVVAYGASRVMDGDLTVGSFFSFLAALLLTYQPVNALAGLRGSLREGRAAAQNLFELLNEPATIHDRDGAGELVVKGGRIRLEGAFFTYDGEKTALDGLTLDLPAGRIVALVGPHGAGKTTILNLIPRFYDVTDGRVTIDGTDTRTVTLASLRGKIAFVSQDTTLFADTVRANVGFGRPGATDAEIEEAARHAFAHDFITALPQGYDTLVGEGGVTLSAGQSRRLAIARAMLKDAPILLLDEAAGGLDPESERLVQAALDRLMKGRTTVVVTDRLSTIVTAHLIHVIDRGRLVQSGTHHELLERGGLYARLYAHQAETGDHPASQHARV